MNRIDAVILALAAAAAAQFRPNGFAQRRPEVEAYRNLRLHLDYTANAATAVFATPSDLKDSSTILTSYLEE